MTDIRFGPNEDRSFLQSIGLSGPTPLRCPTKTWSLEAFDAERDEYVGIPGDYLTREEVEQAAQNCNRDPQRLRLYIVTPDGRRIRV